MTITDLLTRPCTLLRRSDTGATDDYGNTVSTVTEVETVCELQQRRRDEQDDQGELSDTLWLLILPAGTELTTGDAVVVDGERFEVFGAPWPVRNPRTGVDSHVEATVRRTAAPGDGAA